jgi:hypothetical protein
MDKTAITMRVVFDETFWVGIIERIVDARL